MWQIPVAPVDEPTTKPRKYNSTYAPKQRAQVDKYAEETVLLGIFPTTLLERGGQISHGCTTMQLITTCNKFGDSMLDHQFAKFNSPPILSAIRYNSVNL